jgi:hypothetical protein
MARHSQNDDGDLAESDTDNHVNYDDTPNEIRDFISGNGIGNKYQCIIKEHVPGGGQAILESLNNRHPEIEEMGKQWGPGTYTLVFSWSVPKPGGGKEKQMKNLTLEFSERSWRDIHEDWLFERNRERKAKRATDLEKARQEAELRSIESGGKEPQADPLEALKKALETAKTLGIPIGGGKESKGLDLMGIATLLTALKPLLEGLFGGKQNDSTILIKAMEAQQATNMLLMKTLLENPSGRGNSPEGAHMDKILDMTMKGMGRVLEMQDMLKPAEKETLVDRIFGMVDKFLPNVLELAKLSKDARERDMMYKIAAGSKEMKQAREHPDVALALVNKWDEFYGFQTTNEILKVAGIERPPATADNLAKFPSDGYGPDGNRLGEKFPGGESGKGDASAPPEAVPANSGGSEEDDGSE